MAKHKKPSRGTRSLLCAAPPHRAGLHLRSASCLTAPLNRRTCHRRSGVNCIVTPARPHLGVIFAACAVREAACPTPMGIQHMPPRHVRDRLSSPAWTVIRALTFHVICRALLIGMLRNAGAITTRVIVFNLERRDGRKQGSCMRSAAANERANLS